MKKIYFSIITMLLINVANSQPLTFKMIGEGKIRNDTLFIKESSKPCFLIVENSIKGNLDILVEAVAESASTNDYEVFKMSDKLSLNSKNGYKDFVKLDIKPDSYDESRETFKLKLTYSVNGSLLEKSITVQIDPEKDNTEVPKKKKAVQIMYLNAFNFDFGNTNSQSNYVGHLNILSANTSKKWGVNTGVMKINYSQNDATINEVHVIENVLINPFEGLSTNTKYLKQLNSYKTSKKNTVWSLYAQPLFRISKPDNTNEVFAHGHLELLPSSWNSKTTITNMKQDTAIFLQGSPAIVTRTILSNTSSYTINGAYGYFGAGLTFNLSLWDDGKFFFQPTLGVTTNFPQPSSVDINSSTFPYQKRGDENKWSSFYLIRAYYMHQIGESSTLVVGSDIRGLFPQYSPLYAIYTGLNLSINKVVELISGEKKK